MLKKTIRLSTRLLVFTIVCFHHTALQAQWDFIAHPESPVTASARIGNRLFAGVEGGGLYYSDDFGRHWLTTQGS
ncbi:MAG: hypothetical protein ABIQ93_11105, partial [Saprospiraceae bacterium]